MADGRVGQQAFQVVLEQRHSRAYQQRCQAAQADQVEPEIGARQRRIETGQQEHARLHHGGGVKVGGYRRGRGHGVGQPEMERELRGLGEYPQQHQHQGHRVEGVRADLIARREDLGQFEAAGHLPQQQHPGEQGQAAATGDRQGHARALARIGAMPPEADQEEGRQAGQLPEHQHQQQVLGQHHAEHGAHEQQQEGEEAPHGLFFRQVVAGVEDDQQADAQDQQGKEETQAIEAQAETQAETGKPGQDELQCIAGEDAIGLEQQQDQAAQRH
ncbi:hypothetical protein D3C84_422720 [compost metagenome]